MKRALLFPWAASAVSLVFASTCAFDAGEPFATLRPTFAATLDLPSERQTSDGYLRLESDYEFKVDEAALEVASIEILSSAPGTAVAIFDPANPPAGYGNCHGGHCHASDGSIVDYADIEAALAGDEAASLDVALELSLAAPVDLLAHGTPLIPTCSSAELEGCGLGAGTIQRVEVRVSKLFVRGHVRDALSPARIDPRDVALEIDVPSETSGLFTHVVDFVAERHGDPTFELPMHLTIGAAIFDALDWSAPSPDLHGLLHALTHATFEVGGDGEQGDHDHSDHAEGDVHGDHDESAHEEEGDHEH